MLAVVVWLLPTASVPPGTWLFGVAAILIGINALRFLKHLTVSGTIPRGGASTRAKDGGAWTPETQRPPLSGERPHQPGERFLPHWPVP